MNRFRSMRDDDRGLGIITVIFVMAIISALAVTATALTVNNLGNARRDRQSLSALATSEAGVSQAIQRLRTGNLSQLSCMEPLPGALPTGPVCTSTTMGWTSATSPMQVNVDGTVGSCVTSKDCFKVWIGTVAPYVPNCPARHASPPASCSGVYRVHSTGVSGNGPGARKLAVDVKVTPYPYPIGVFSEQTMSGNGNVGIHSESIFTNGCMMNRQDDSHSGSGTQFQWDSVNNRPVIDLVYDQPAAAHATGKVDDHNNSCNQSIHETNSGTQVKCNTTFPYDQDSGGGSLTAGDGCYGKYTRSDGSVYPTTSLFTATDLQNVGYRPRGLTDAQYDALKEQAQAEGTYNLATGSISSTLTSLLSAGVTSPVLYWDTASVSLHSTDFPSSFLRSIDTSSSCSSNSVTIVVNGSGHDLDYQGGNTGPYLVAALFVPDGTLTGSGGRNTIGTVFAKTVDLGGNVDFYMDQCFASNPPGATLDAQVINWREDDSKDIN
ncbi:MAG: hypothetical protein QOE64_1295 [Frankiales bacterium]|jgi:type II secretory pathway pseudopilin PulG|nr:hypothetical protein [Frankiales bacterium]